MSSILDTARRSLPGRVSTKFIADGASDWAVQIAWNALLSMFPIILISVAALGAILSVAGYGGEEVRSSIASLFPDADAQHQVQKALDTFKQQTGVLAVVGFGGLFLSGSALFGTMDRAFAHVYGVRPRGLLPQRLMSIGMVLLFTVLIGLDVASSSVLPGVKHLGGFIPAVLTVAAVAFALQLVVGLAAGFVLFTTVYFVVPNRRQRWSEVLPGAALAAGLLELVTLLFPLYLSLNHRLAAYGQTFGLLFVLMTFFFFLGLITMAGAELNSVAYPATAAKPSQRTP